MGRTKSRPRPIVKKRKFLGLPVQKHKLEKRNIVKLCVTKLARIEDPQAKLCKAVLINNTLKNLQRQPECAYSDLECHEELNKPEIIEKTQFDRFDDLQLDVVNVVNPSVESVCSHIDSSSRVINDNELSERTIASSSCDSITSDTMSLCDDIINEFLGVSDHVSEHPSELSNSQDIYEKLIKSHSWLDQSDDNKENLSENVEAQGDIKKTDTLHQFGGSPVSPYSYSSFLSEVYKVTLRKMKHKVQL